LFILVSEPGIEGVLMRNYAAYVIQKGKGFAVLTERFDKDCVIMGDKREYFMESLKDIKTDRQSALNVARILAESRADSLAVERGYALENRTSNP
jgi:hypothetical protein